MIGHDTEIAHDQNMEIHSNLLNSVGRDTNPFACISSSNQWAYLP